MGFSHARKGHVDTLGALQSVFAPEQRPPCCVEAVLAHWHHREVGSNIPDTVNNPLHREMEAKPMEEDLLSSVNHTEFSRTEIREKLFFSRQ